MDRLAYPSIEDDQTIKEKPDAYVDAINAQQALFGLGKPDLRPIKMGETRSEGIQLESRGFFQIFVDPRAVAAVLIASGLRHEDLADLTVEFRAATITDKDFYGGVIGGINSGNHIELYTSFPTGAFSPFVGDAFHCIRDVHFPVKKDDLVRTLAHELRHFAQFKRDLYTSDEMSSFYAATKEDHDAYPPEQDAISFESALMDRLQPFLEIQPFQAPELQEMYEPALRALPELPYREQTEEFLDTTRVVARVTETDPPGLLLLEEVRGLTVAKPRPIPYDVYDKRKVEGLVGRINDAVNDKSIGFREARYLCDRILDATDEFGAEDAYSLVKSYREKHLDLVE